MKALVAYLSKTGNTKKVAQAIFEEISDEKEIKPIDEVESIEGYDIAFLGFPIHAMGPDKKTVELLGKHCVNGRNVALFITHMAPEDAQELPTWLDKFRQAASVASIVDVFDCQGQVAKPIKLFMSIAPDAKLRSWARKDNSKGQPDKARLDRARAFSRDVMKRLREGKTRAEDRKGKQQK
jgi:flavodoxin